MTSGTSLQNGSPRLQASLDVNGSTAPSIMSTFCQPSLSCGTAVESKWSPAEVLQAGGIKLARNDWLSARMHSRVDDEGEVKEAEEEEEEEEEEEDKGRRELEELLPLKHPVAFTIYAFSFSARASGVDMFHLPCSEIAPAKRPLAAGVIMRPRTTVPPDDFPAIVTRRGSPPKLAMFWRVHRRARRRS
jgi:hypothetical protein